MSAATDNDEKAMATDVIAPGAGGADEGGGDEEPRRPQPGPSQQQGTGGGGFFHLYKSGQGYWTRMGTAAGAALVGLLFASFIYTDIAARVDYLSKHRDVALYIAAAFLLVYGLLVWWYLNKPSTADFLIATDSEMKKVNWTSRKELIGSTKIVILFMFLIAFLLFAIDIVFGYVFHWIKVLKSAPF